MKDCLTVWRSRVKFCVRVQFGLNSLWDVVWKLFLLCLVLNKLAPSLVWVPPRKVCVGDVCCLQKKYLQSSSASLCGYFIFDLFVG